MDLQTAIRARDSALREIEARHVEDPRAKLEKAESTIARIQIENQAAALQAAIVAYKSRWERNQAAAFQLRAALDALNVPAALKAAAEVSSTYNDCTAASDNALAAADGFLESQVTAPVKDGPDDNPSGKLRNWNRVFGLWLAKFPVPYNLEVVLTDFVAHGTQPDRVRAGLAYAVSPAGAPLLQPHNLQSFDASRLAQSIRASRSFARW